MVKYLSVGYLWTCVSTRCTAWSISSVVTPGLTIKAAISRTSRASCVIGHGEAQVNCIENLKSDKTKAAPRRPFPATLHTTLMPSMSSPERILICDVPFRNCSDSETPAWGKTRRAAVIHPVGPIGRLRKINGRLSGLWDGPRLRDLVLTDD